MKRVLPFLIIIAVLGSALLAAWSFKRSNAGTPRSETSGKVPKSATDEAKLGAAPPHALGNPNARVMIEEFGDFQCIPCGLLHPILKNLKTDFGERLVIVFREFPLSTVHPHAAAAARVAEAAGSQGKFWEMHDLLYENQNAWRDASDPQPSFEQYATSIGLDMDRFKRDVLSQGVERRISLDKERGYWIGVNSTPTVFLNGREVNPGFLTADKLRSLINDQLQSR